MYLSGLYTQLWCEGGATPKTPQGEIYEKEKSMREINYLIGKIWIKWLWKNWRGILILIAIKQPIGLMLLVFPTEWKWSITDFSISSHFWTAGIFASIENSAKSRWCYKEKKQCCSCRSGVMVILTQNPWKFSCTESTNRKQNHIGQSSAL